MKQLISSRPDAVLKNVIDNKAYPAYLRKAHARDKEQRPVIKDVWVDNESIPLCFKGEEAPFWTVEMNNVQ